MAILRYPSSMAYFPLPKRKTSNIFSIETGAGKITLMNPEFIPFGLSGRWALLGLSQLAIKNGNDNGYIEDISIYELLKFIIGKKPSGKQLDAFCPQLIAWVNTSISIMRYSEFQKTYKNLCFVSDAKILLNKHLEEDEHIFLRFSAEGKEFFSSNLLPLPIDAVHAIKTTRDFDVLCWIISFVYLCQSKQKESIFVSWNHIYKQFNIPQAHHSRFRTEFCTSATFLWKNFYKGARLEQTKDQLGIRIQYSPLLTPKDGQFYIPSSFIGGSENAR